MAIAHKKFDLPVDSITPRIHTGEPGTDFSSAKHLFYYNSKSIEILFQLRLFHSWQWYRYKFSLMPGSIAVVSWAKFCCDQFIWIWMREKWFVRKFWIVMEKSLVKRAPGNRHASWCELGHHWFREWLVAYPVPSHYMKQCWSPVHCAIKNKVQLNLSSNTK